jgi:hypothetical protein
MGDLSGRIPVQRQYNGDTIFFDSLNPAYRIQTAHDLSMVFKTPK